MDSTSPAGPGNGARYTGDIAAAATPSGRPSVLDCAGHAVARLQEETREEKPASSDWTFFRAEDRAGGRSTHRTQDSNVVIIKKTSTRAHVDSLAGNWCCCCCATGPAFALISPVGRRRRRMLSPPGGRRCDRRTMSSHFDDVRRSARGPAPLSC